MVARLRAALAQKLGRKVAASVVYRMLARHGWRKVAPDTRHPKSDPKVQEEWKKTLRDTGSPIERRCRQGATCPSDVSRRSTLFGRTVRIRRSWAPTPERPVVSNGYEREFVYVCYGAISPVEGEFDWMVCRKMNTEQTHSSARSVPLPPMNSC